MNKDTQDAIFEYAIANSGELTVLPENLDAFNKAILEKYPHCTLTKFWAVFNYQEEKRLSTFGEVVQRRYGYEIVTQNRICTQPLD